tara:strand:- start:27 stop:128 length:102 start_codon:yes stop_codon:yes gene_type:complete
MNIVGDDVTGLETLPRCLVVPETLLSGNASDSS